MESLLYGTPQSAPEECQLQHATHSLFFSFPTHVQPLLLENPYLGVIQGAHSPVCRKRGSLNRGVAVSSLKSEAPSIHVQKEPATHWPSLRTVGK